MSPRYSEELMERILRASDLVEIISGYTSLKKTGKSYKGNCPFHQEKTPSFVVDANKGLYHCFGCGAGGNLFRFLQGVENISFPEAVELAATKAGISIPVLTSPLEEKRAERRKKVVALHEEATSFFHRHLLKNKKALEYLERRGYSKETILTFQLGYAPPGWDHLCKYFSNQNVPLALLEEAGLIVERTGKDGYYDRFRHRIIFPIQNYQGEIVGFGGRVLDDTLPKYLNSPETPIFQKKNTLYGLYQSLNYFQREGEAIIVEGYTDVMTAYQEGIKGVVASLGTAFTPYQAKLLKRYVSMVYIGYDADTAGAKATWRGLDILEEEGLKVRVLPIPKGSDPDDLIQKEGRESFLSLKDRSLSLFKFKLNTILGERKIEGAEEKVEVSQEIFGILDEIKNKIQQEEYLKEVSSLLLISFETLKEEFNKYQRRQGRKKGISASQGSSSKPLPFNLQKELLVRSEEKILMYLITLSNQETLVKENIELDDFFTNEGRDLARFLYETSHLFEKGPDYLASLLEDEVLLTLFSRLQMRGEREEGGDPLLSIRRLKEFRWMEEKKKIWEKIMVKKKEKDLPGLNRLLLLFCRLLAEEEIFERKEGELCRMIEG